MEIETFENFPLFKECIEILDATVLTLEGDNNMTDLFKKLYPITDWGKIDWDKIENKIEAGYDPKNIIPVLEKILTEPLDPSVYVLWSSGSIRLIRTTIHKIIEHFDDVTCVSFEKFIFNPRQGYIIEILPSDLTTVGVINK